MRRPLIYALGNRPNWFVLAQTDGADYGPADLPGWQEGRALEVLEVTREAFHHLDGNAQGYATGRTVAVSPVAFMPHRTLFHELAHVVLGHTAETARLVDTDRTPVSIREVEAEAVITGSIRPRFAGIGRQLSQCP